MTATATIGIDIGGTSIKAGLVDAAGRILARRQFAYGIHESYDALIEALTGMIAELQNEGGGTAAAIGIAAPGHARLRDGVMVDGTANVPLLKDRSPAADLCRRTGKPCVTANDGNAAALGELRFGAGRGLSRFVVLTFGTGVGGGVVIGGDVVQGDDGEPPELGAMMLDDGRGRDGTFEAFACARGFATAYAKAGGHAGAAPEEIFARAAAGERAAITAVDLTCRRIAQACGTLINVLNLQACLLGGGISRAGVALRDGVRGHLPDFTWPFLLMRARVDLAETAQNAGILGAAASALIHLERAPRGK